MMQIDEVKNVKSDTYEAGKGAAQGWTEKGSLRRCDPPTVPCGECVAILVWNIRVYLLMFLTEIVGYVSWKDVRLGVKSYLFFS